MKKIFYILLATLSISTGLMAAERPTITKSSTDKAKIELCSYMGNMNYLSDMEYKRGYQQGQNGYPCLSNSPAYQQGYQAGHYQRVITPYQSPYAY